MYRVSDNKATPVPAALDVQRSSWDPSRVGCWQRKIEHTVRRTTDDIVEQQFNDGPCLHFLLRHDRRQRTATVPRLVFHAVEWYLQGQLQFSASCAASLPGLNGTRTYESVLSRCDECFADIRNRFHVANCDTGLV